MKSWRTLRILVEGIIFGLPHNIEENPVYKAILEVLLIRLANIFNTIPYTAVREFILNSLSHIIGEYSGIDGDGLPAEDIVELYKMILKHIPREINGQPVAVKIADIDNLIRYAIL